MPSNPIVLRAKTDSKVNEVRMMSNGIVRLMVRKRIAWSIKHSRIVEVYRLFAGLAPRFAPQVESRRILGIRSRHAGDYFAGRMSEWQETNIPSAFRFQGIHWESGIASTSWMRHMIGATSNGMSRFNVPKIEHQRSVNRYGGMQTGSGGPSSIANTRNPRT